MQIAWKNIAAGDRTTYSEAYLLLYKRFYNYGCHLTFDISLVEDAIQEVLLFLWTGREKLLAISNPEGYFYSLFRRSLFKKIKKSTTHVAVDGDDWEPEFSADAIMIKKEAATELQKKLQSALATLTPRQREAIYLLFYEGLSYQDVASMLDISVKASYKIVARALLSLKDKMMVPTACLFLMLKN